MLPSATARGLAGILIPELYHFIVHGSWRTADTLLKDSKGNRLNAIEKDIFRYVSEQSGWEYSLQQETAYHRHDRGQRTEKQHRPADPGKGVRTFAELNSIMGDLLDAQRSEVREQHDPCDACNQNPMGTPGCEP